ncbi:hypothetical protein GCM10010517_59440 [Streptosporangium fragile]|uniref:Uncharacterized protein n=1 Tax=Streptosporangium fragile TaxID=46186 RepID=A0ABP6IL83_9ACTN
MSALDMLREENDRYMKTFGESALVKLVRSCGGDGAATVRARIADHLQVWSDTFQRVMLVRAALETEESLSRLASAHLLEEIGHNRLLAEGRDGRDAEWDPVVAAASAWFVDRMTISTADERIVLAHLVLEGSGLVFLGTASAVYGESGYFGLHSEADQEHLELGYRALGERAGWRPEDVRRVLDEGWQVMTALCDRIAERAAPVTGRTS